VNVSRTILTPAAIIVGLCFAGCGGTDSPAAPTNEATPGVSTQSQVAGPASQASSALSGHHAGFMRALHGMNLSDQQRSQIMQLMQQYHQAHPQGSAVDPQARRALHQQILAILTPQQQAQWKQHMQPWHGRGAMRGITLSDQQKSQIKTLVEQFRQAHASGTAIDPQARQELQQQILKVLTPQQQAQYQQNLQQMHKGFDQPNAAHHAAP
jgi:Spy/CpxP family protein refolding chaperone